jgi:hypothetical protein
MGIPFLDTEHQIRWHAQRFQILNAKSVDSDNVSRHWIANPLTGTAFPAFGTPNSLRNATFPNSEQQIRWHAQRFQILNAKFIDKHNVSRVATQSPLTGARFQILNIKSADKRNVSRQVALVASPFKPPPSC